MKKLDFFEEINILIADDDQFSCIALKTIILKTFSLFEKKIHANFTIVYNGNDCINEL